MQLAKSWTLPISIMSGLTATYAIPWSFGDIDGYFIFTTVFPLLAQAIVAAATAVLAFLGKSSWLSLQITLLVIACINYFGFIFGVWGVDLPTLPKVLLALTTISLIPVLIWGRKRIDSNTNPMNQSSEQMPPDNSNW